MDLNELERQLSEARDDASAAAVRADESLSVIEDLLALVRQRRADLADELRTHQRSPCPHCHRCPECGWDRHPCVCP